MFAPVCGEKIPRKTSLNNSMHVWSINRFNEICIAELIKIRETLMHSILMSTSY